MFRGKPTCCPLGVPQSGAEVRMPLFGVTIRNHEATSIDASLCDAEFQLRGMNKSGCGSEVDPVSGVFPLRCQPTWNVTAK